MDDAPMTRMRAYYSLIPDITVPEQRGTVSGGVQLLGGIALIAYYVVGSEIWDAHQAATIYMVAAVVFFAALITVGFVREPAAFEEASSGGGGVLPYGKGLAEETNAVKYPIRSACSRTRLFRRMSR